MNKPLLEALELTAQEMRDAYQMASSETTAVSWYEWFAQPGGIWRTKCKEHGVMSWALKIDKRYPDTTSKHSRRVFFKGRMVQVGECKPCGKWVVK